MVDGIGPDDEGVIVLYVVLFDVLLFEEHVPDQAAGLPFPCDIVDFVQIPFCVLALVLAAVLEEGPVAVDGPEKIVPDVFGLSDLVVMESAFPPVAAGSDLLAGLFVELDGPVADGEGDIFFHQCARPGDGSPQDHVVRLVRSQGFPRVCAHFPAGTVFGSGEIAEIAVA